MGTLRHRAGRLFSVACAAADPTRALRAACRLNPPPKPAKGGKYIVVSIGKAAIAMAEEMLDQLAPHPIRALAVTNRENFGALSGATVMVGGHPIPDEHGLEASRAVRTLLSRSSADDQVIALISGGGSALLPAPAGELSLADKAEVNRLMLKHGLDIHVMNLVRQQLSRLKGGGLLHFANPASVTAYILSDVIGDDLSIVASGPTVAPIGTREDARSLLEARGLWLRLPDVVRDHLGRRATEMAPLPPAQNFLIGSNRMSLDAVAAAASDLNPAIVCDRLIGDVADATEQIVHAARNVPHGQPACLIFGGETTVAVGGTGLGGRNQELALRVARAMPDLDRDWAFLSGGTDGRDGPTEAAGGVVDAGTIGRIRARGGNPDELLANNDSNTALRLAGDLLITGGTGTNVADVQIFLLGR
ncbi:MOFRL domain-containing protein [Ruegeria sp. PBVC088]|nr:MOFRL domain-containing protein [Ruegeria sp. PBVC088]